MKMTNVKIELWLRQRIGELLEIAPDKVDINKSLTKYGLDSSAALGLTQELAAWLGEDLDPTIIYDYPTIAQLAHHLSQ
jgi:acyl carrier protein